MASASFPPLVGRRGLLAMSAALGLRVVPASSPRVFARQANPEPSLLVRGEIEIPADAHLSWRIVREEAEMPQDAAFAKRATGFVVASSLFNSLLATDEATGSAYRSLTDEAGFVRDGTS